MVTLRKGEVADDGALSFLKIDALPKELEAEFVTHSHLMPRERLTQGSWQFEDAPLAKLRDKIVKEKKTVGEPTQNASVARSIATPWLSRI